MTQVNDRRAQVLEELVSLLSTLTITLTGTNATPAQIPAGNFVHNRNELEAALVPGIILLDGDEINDPNLMLRAPGMTVTPMPPQIMKMTPEIYIVLDQRKPRNLNVGEDLGLARQQILAAIVQDQTLTAIIGPNGRITFDGAYTDLARNRTMQGQMGLSFTFTYPLKPNEIVGI